MAGPACRLRTCGGCAATRLNAQALTQQRGTCVVAGLAFPRNGVNDLRMGSTTHQLRCQTCECSYQDCPGHFGHITLVKPVFEVGMLDKTLAVLRCVCFNCGRLLANKVGRRFPGPPACPAAHFAPRLVPRASDPERARPLRLFIRAPHWPALIAS